MSMPRILILMTEMGFGHKSAAQAIATAAEREFGDQCDVKITNPMSNKKTPSLVRDVQSQYYDQSVQNHEIYEAMYKLGDTSIAAAAMERGLMLLLFQAVREEIETYEPDVVIVVHENYLAPLQAFYETTNKHIPTITVITDLTTIHRMWYHPVSDICVVPTEQAYDKALEQKLKPAQVQQLGIPVHPDLSEEQHDKAALQRELGWASEYVTVLVVGSKRVQDLPEKLHGINHSRLPLQLILVAGGDDETHAEFQNIDWHHPTHIYNFVDNLPTMMHASDIVLSKAGGLIVSEALACGLPLLLADVIPGQETGNAEYVVAGDAGALTETPLALLEVLFHWLDNDAEQLKQVAQRASELGKPRAAHDIAALAMQLAREANQSS